MAYSIGKKFTAKTLLYFAFPSMVMMSVMSLYTIIDGIVVSRFVGSNALSAINIVYPVYNLLLAVGIMFSTGGSAVIGRKLGEGKENEARSVFSMLALVGIFLSVILFCVSWLCQNSLSRFLGANDILMPYCRTYLVLLMAFAPASFLQIMYQALFVTAGRPGIGMALTITAGVVNAVLDVFFMGYLNMGIAGAAVATGTGQLIPAVVGTIFFLTRRQGLRYGKAELMLPELKKTCTNGMSEMVGQISIAITTFVFNKILMEMAGPDGVAAITIILYSQFLFGAVYSGFAMGVAPIFSFNLGAQKIQEIQRLHRISLSYVLGSSVLITGISFLLAGPVVGCFADANTNTYQLAYKGFRLFALTYLFNGSNLFYSGLFTALSDGKSSAIVSFFRTFVFLLASLAVLPRIMGINGVWLAIPMAELMTIFVVYNLYKRNPNL